MSLQRTRCLKFVRALCVLQATGTAGSIVNIGSIAAWGGAPFILAYSCSKAALQALTKSSACELRASRIRVNQINMG